MKQVESKKKNFVAFCAVFAEKSHRCGSCPTGSAVKVSAGMASGIPRCEGPPAGPGDGPTGAPAGALRAKFLKNPMKCNFMVKKHINRLGMCRIFSNFVIASKEVWSKCAPPYYIENQN
ncbi:MAG: hypothetical protein HDS92_01385 [Bacteroidales bacterium]|nr:hypothetical protein [Bacteroidales bacterium]